MDEHIRFLLADDDEDDVLLFKLALKELSIKSTVDIVTDGKQLMERLNTVTPDILILDINMPCKNGLDCLTEIRMNDFFRRMPIVIYSTSNHRDKIERAYNSGANKFVIKGSDFDKIKQAVREVFSLDIEELRQQPALDSYVINKNVVTC